MSLFTDLIKANKIILGPSDTILGLYGIASHEAFLSLNKLKNRCKKPYLLLIKNKEVAIDFIAPGQFEPFQKCVY